MNRTKYTAIMIDVVESRKYDNRNEIQQYLKNIVNFIDKIFCKSIKKRLMFSAGDEIQGLFLNPFAAYICARFFMMICFPVKIRVGIGYGELAYDNDMWKSSEMDGIAYHNARYALNSFDGKNSFGIRFNSKKPEDRIINALLYSSQIIQRQQSINVQNIKLVAELIFPIFDETIMESYMEYTEELQLLLDERQNILKSSNLYMNTTRLKELHSMSKIQLKVLSYELFKTRTSDVFEKSGLLIDNTWKKGMATTISELLGTTRQNIDQHVRIGKIEENRKIDFSIVYYLSEVFHCD